MTVVEFVAGQVGRIYVEVSDRAGDDSEIGLVRAGDRIVRAAAHTWHGTPEGVRSAAEGALGQLRSLEPLPEEVEVTFGVAVDGKLGATLVSTGANAHLNVEVVWRNVSGAAAPDAAS